MLKNEQSNARRLRAAILIGGQSRRMGRPKALLEIDGESLSARTIRVVEPFVESTVLIGNVPKEVASAMKVFSHSPAGGGAGRYLRLDDALGAVGPIAGILAALEYDSSCDWLVIACDMPAMSEPAISWLLDRHSPAVPATVGVFSDLKEVQPLPGIYTPISHPILRACIDSANWSLRAALAAMSAKQAAIPLEHAVAWRNINTPFDWANYLSGARAVVQAD